jgi:hypothetical protein
MILKPYCKLRNIGRNHKNEKIKIQGNFLMISQIQIYFYYNDNLGLFFTNLTPKERRRNPVKELDFFTL